MSSFRRPKAKVYDIELPVIHGWISGLLLRRFSSALERHILCYATAAHGARADRCVARTPLNEGNAQIVIIEGHSSLSRRLSLCHFSSGDAEGPFLVSADRSL